MKAIILAAGRGSRMKSLTDDSPKCLVHFQGRALLDWQIQAIRQSGINEIAVVTGYQRTALMNYINPEKEFYNSDWADTNMVYSLACAREWLVKYDCIVSYSDIFYETDAVKSLIRCSNDIAVTYDVNWLQQWSARFNNPLVDAETFKVSEDGYVAEIGKTALSLDQIQGQYMGLLKFTPNGWLRLEGAIDFLSAGDFKRVDMTSSLQKVVEGDKKSIFAVPYAGLWGEVDTENDLQVHQSIHLLGKMPL
jgi:choline kinase